MKSSHWIAIQIVCTAIGSLLSRALGGFDNLIKVLIIFVVFDYITGIICAVSYKKLSSSIGWRGILKKTLIFMVVSMSSIIDRFIFEEDILRTVIIFFYLSNEGISILENLVTMGIPVPEKLKAMLESFRNKDN